MAWVYRAWDLALDRPVAVKILFPQYSADPGFLERFRREARLAAAVSSHPNVVHVYDVGQDGETYFLVMELIEGETLRDRIARQGQMDASSAFAVGRQVAAALEYAHGHGLVHRDIKPQNILIEPNGQVKVVDFGIAAAENATPLTAPGWLLGSIPYVSPEQLEGAVASPASDLYALGVVLYEMLTGRVPFIADHPAGMLARQQRGIVPAINALNPAVPAAAAAAVTRALERDPRRRYARAAAMREALADPDVPPERTVVAPLRRPVEDNRIAVASVGQPGARANPGPGAAARDPVLPWLGALAILVVGGSALGILLPRSSAHSNAGTASLHSRVTHTPTAAPTSTPLPAIAATASPTAPASSPTPTEVSPSPSPTPTELPVAQPAAPQPTQPPVAPAPPPAVPAAPIIGPGPGHGHGPKPGKGPKLNPGKGHGKGHDKGQGEGDG